jgi:hypothetical protein
VLCRRGSGGRLSLWQDKGLEALRLGKPRDLRRTLNQSPSEILAAFTTREELEQWLEDLYKEPEPKKKASPTLFDIIDEQPEQEIQPKTVGKSIQEILIDEFGDNPPKGYAAAAQWLQGKIEHFPKSMRLKWVKPLRDVDTLVKHYGMQLTTYYLRNDLQEEFSYGEFVDGTAMMCIVFYQHNGGEMDEETRQFLEKNKLEFGYGDEGEQIPLDETKLKTIGSGPNKLIISQIL